MYMQFLIRVISKLENKYNLKAKTARWTFVILESYRSHCQKTEEMKLNCQKYIRVSVFKALLSKTTSVTDVAGSWCDCLR